MAPKLFAIVTNNDATAVYKGHTLYRSDDFGSSFYKVSSPVSPTVFLSTYVSQPRLHGIKSDALYYVLPQEVRKWDGVSSLLLDLTGSRAFVNRGKE